MATDRSTVSVRICSIARAVSIWICFSAFLTIAAASARDFCFSSSRSASASDRLREMIDSASTRACRIISADSRCRRSSSWRAFWASSSDLRNGRAAALQRVEQRPPGELRQQPDEDEERQDGPDEEPGIGLDQRVVHDLPQEHDQQTEHLGENRDAFEQEERQVDRAGDLGGRARLARDPLGQPLGQLADAETRADDGQSKADPSTHAVPKFHSVSLR